MENLKMQTICAECGGVYPLEDTIHYGNVNVCSGCKPVFMQKLAEGASVKTGELHYAGFWIRLLATFVDNLVNLSLQFILGLAMGFSFLQIAGLQSRGSTFATIGLSVMQYVIAAIYEILLVGRYGATFGKMACGLRIVRENGKPVSFALSTG